MGRLVLKLWRHNKKCRDDQIRIGDDIIISLTDAGNGWAEIAIEAASYIPVHRREVYEAIRRSGGVDRKGRALRGGTEA